MKWFIIAAVFLMLFLFITIPNFVSIRIPNPDVDSNSDIKNAYTAAQAYFTDYPNGSVNLEILKAYGFRASKGVTLSLGGTSHNSLSMNARHVKGKKTFQIDWQGNVVPCCFDKDSTYIMGNIISDSVTSIWNSDRYCSFRNQLNRFGKKLPMCRDCSEGLRRMTVHM